MNAAWKEEVDRQSQELAEILQGQIDNFGRRLKAEGKAPMLNAVAGAIATVTGLMLASVEDRRIRRELRRTLDRAVTRATMNHEGRAGSVTFIEAGRRADA